MSVRSFASILSLGASLAVASTLPAPAALIVNGDFSSSTLGAVSPLTDPSTQADAGWFTYNTAAWSISGGEMVRGNFQTSNNGRGFGQLFTAPALTGTNDFFFDLTVTNAASGWPNVNWYLVGYILTTSGTPNFDTDEDMELNLVAQNIPATGANYAVTVLGSGSDILSSQPGGAGTFSGTISASIDSGTTGYDYYGVAFSSNGDIAGGDAIAFDNVVLVPEPQTWALAALGLIGVLLAARSRRVALPR